jgi:hypothetical protein
MEMNAAVAECGETIKPNGRLGASEVKVRKDRPTFEPEQWTLGNEHMACWEDMMHHTRHKTSRPNSVLSSILSFMRYRNVYL